MACLSPAIIKHECIPHPKNIAPSPIAMHSIMRFKVALILVFGSEKELMMSPQSREKRGSAPPTAIDEINPKTINIISFV
jgi:hypothetical protein